MSTKIVARGRLGQDSLKSGYVLRSTYRLFAPGYIVLSNCRGNDRWQVTAFVLCCIQFRGGKLSSHSLSFT